MVGNTILKAGLRGNALLVSTFGSSSSSPQPTTFKTFLITQNCHNPQPTTPSSPPPPPPQQTLTPFLQDFLHQQNPNKNSSGPFNPPSPISRNRTRIGKSRDYNRGKPRLNHRMSNKGQQVLQSLIEESFDVNDMDSVLVQFVESYQDVPVSKMENLSFDLLGIVKGLGFTRMMISMLGKQGKVSVAASLLHNLHKDGLCIDVYAYTSLITAYASNGRYGEAVMLFKKMEEEGCKPTLITYNVILKVYGKRGMPWNEIMALVGVALCMKRQLRRPKEAMEVLREMDTKGCLPSIVTYNSLISAYARDGLLKEAMELTT
ncbi:hypothetical protein LWI28_005497 [Acer negundo]|uniref:Pentatricopeptide repeat-containing protein n=1 Tax=Acer negundo TaxID=4023 RepID=A0AAD5IYN8_ACENE|nr:hypothetical protein LWI28_005497 [Acer negundo]